MKYEYEVKEISKDIALDMIHKYHYSNTLPKLNKHFVGFYLDGTLVGVITLGWGTQPEYTIKKIFPSLSTKDYYEIGRMCMTEEMPRNSESQMISQLISWLKATEPAVKVLFTWADGMLGKCGYVYQACSFYYAGYYLTDIYLKDGVKIHPRQTRAFFRKGKDDKRLTVRPTPEQMEWHGIKHYKGKQYKYLFFLCNKAEKKRLMKESKVKLSFDYPKESDLLWKTMKDGKWIESGMPIYKTDMNPQYYSAGLNSERQLTIFDIM